MNNVYPIVTHQGIRKDGTLLFVHIGTAPTWPVHVLVVKNGWKNSKAYCCAKDAMEAVSAAWPDVKWTKIKNVDFVKFVLHEHIVHEDDYAANVVACYFRNIFDLEEADECLDFQMDGKFYSVEFGDIHMDEQLADMYGIPEKYGYWQFYDENEKELVELRWEH